MGLCQYSDQSECDFLQRQAYEAYQQAICLDARCDTLWMSVGLLYYRLNQFKDCLDAFSRSIRLTPYKPLVWRNLGVLVSSSLNGGHRSV